MGYVYEKMAESLNRRLQARGPLPDNVREGSFTRLRSLSPYFRNMWKAGVVCPDCGGRYVRIRPSLSPDVAFLECRCGYFQVVVSPLKSSPEATERWERQNSGAGIVMPFRQLSGGATQCFVAEAALLEDTGDGE